MKAALNPIDESPNAFSGASILPEQYLSQRRDHRYDGEHNLLFAILEDAIRCYLDHSNYRTPIQRVQYVEAHDWLFSVKDRGPFSFVSVCENLEIDPESLRAGLKRKHARIRAAAIARKSARSGTISVMRGEVAARA